MNRHFKTLILVSGLAVGLLGAIFLVYGFASASIPDQNNPAIIVDTLQDELNQDGDCSLREAIEAANSDTATDACPAGSSESMDTVHFNVGGQIQLTEQLEVIGGGGPLMIDGRRNITLLAANGARVLYVFAGADLVLEGITISNGNGGGQGAGIYNFGTLLLNNSLVSDNFFAGGGQGAGIYNNGMLTVTHSTFSNNQILVEGVGGGILNNGTLTVLNSTFEKNGADRGGGGGIHNNGQLIIRDSTLTENVGHYGGAIINSGVMTMTGCTLSGNGASRGGAIFAGEDTTTIINSTIHGNGASFDGGGIYSQATVNIASSTITGNNARYRGGGVYSQANGSIKNTIVAGNTLTNNEGGPDCYSMGLTSGGYNLIGNAADCSLSPAPGDQTGVDPQLGPLQDNGGPTFTQALAYSSPAFNAGNPAGCTDPLGNLLSTDQRGVGRYAACDIGAYELQPLQFSTKKASDQLVYPGDQIAYTIELKNEAAFSLTDILVTDTLPSSMEYVEGSLTASSGSYEINEGVITWTGTVRASGAETISFGVVIGDFEPGTPITNTALLDAQGGLSYLTSIIHITPNDIYIPQILNGFSAVFFDDFSNPSSGWYIGDTSEVLAEYAGGEYRVLVKPPSSTHVFLAPTFDQINYTVEVDARWDSNSGASYGLVFGLQGDYERFYSFEVNTDYQDYALFRYGPDGWAEIVPPTASSAIQGGRDKNHLKATRNGDAITLEVNGTSLGTWNDGTIKGPSASGLVVSSYDDEGNADAHFDNFTLSRLGGASLSSENPDQLQDNSPLKVYSQIPEDHSKPSWEPNRR